MRYTNKAYPCHDPERGSENADGYVRVVVGSRTLGTRRLAMRHRVQWEAIVGPIPEGYEINHLCRNRRCCNTRHMECITKTDHATKTNLERYSDVKRVGLMLLRSGVSKSEVADETGRTVATINRWIREEKE